MGAMARLAETSESSGLEGLFRSDHYRSIVEGEPAGSLDAWATLAALAARTERIRLGTMVSPVTFRPPAVLAKNVVTVDHISGGRVELGIGAGWYEAEHTSYGFPFGTTRGAWTSSIGSWQRSRATGPRPMTSDPNRCNGRVRRSSSAAARNLGPWRPRSGSRTSTTRFSRPLTRRARGRGASRRQHGRRDGSCFASR